MIQKKYIIFGANGYIGRHLVNTLILEGHSVKAYDVQESPIVEEALYFKNNLLDCDSLKLIDWDVDYVLFFSGINTIMRKGYCTHTKKCVGTRTNRDGSTSSSSSI